MPAAVYLLAALPVCDCILNQLNNAYDFALGPFSMLQAVRATLLVLLGAMALWQVSRGQVKIAGFHICGLAGLAFLGITVTKELLVSGGVSMTSLGSYGQLAYWIVLSMVAASACETRRHAITILYGVAAGALASAVSIELGYFVGGLNPYASDNVSASVGWFHTAKTITGVLLTGSVVLLYLGRKSRSWWPTLLACVCISASVMTYARAGIVALIATVIWFACWFLRFHRSRARRWISRMLLVAVAAACCAPIFVQSESWQSRWEDLDDPAQAGSGRATFWRIALDAYAAGQPVEQAFGFGYEGMAERLLQDYGDDIKHTHNDLLDSMMVGGAVGVLWFGLWVSYVISKTLSLPLSTVEGAAAVAIVLIYLCHSQLTGQLFGTDSMASYVVTLACFYRIDSLRRERGPVWQQGLHPVRPEFLRSRPAPAFVAFK
ncbi:MAG TPA: O-antigen ligase family protein [Bryobacteraceae bacterium]|nr:O-antigen ligase family protein [Bryobacteraceae bacterium]